MPVDQSKYLKKLADTLAERNDADFRKGDVWQSILNLGYERWQSTDGLGLRYHDMVTLVKLDYGEFAALCILLGKYNYQVENGGHVQYYDNGYASVARGRGTYFGGCNSSEVEVHEWMVKWFKKFELDATEIGKKLLDILTEFRIEVDDDESDMSLYDHHRVADARYLDHRYYEIREAWVEHFSKFVAQKVQEQYAHEGS